MVKKNIYFTEGAQREAIHKSSVDQTQDINLRFIKKVARSITYEILYREQWDFTGTFNDFENPPMLHTLLKWILLGTSVERSISVACQYIIQSTKTSRQVNYKPQENVTPNREINCTVETPLYV